MEFKDLDLHAFGSLSMLAGAIYTGQPNVRLWLPGESPVECEDILMSDEDWAQFLKQTDDVNTPVMVGVEKAIFRKAQRVVDQNISWAVYARDGFKCRYCGRIGIPLTVDHVDLWEKGGATIAENLISSCKKDNKNRGNMPYGDWLQSPEYLRVSTNLTDAERAINTAVLTTLPHLETLRVKTIKSR